ncbi:hypothetical protein V1525DRAFT_435377 [Lipomyces kononenkoae]|uniref:Uncharacterized protein n=1 Tax=Lipomyces kononenkoae TaxID=34357 RepID=A0ACC3SSS2_LIPKO
MATSVDEPDKLEMFAMALTQLPLETLHNERARIENSIGHLQRSNREIEQYIAETVGEKEKREMHDVITENEDVITGQMMRIEMIKSEIMRRS